MVPDEDGGPDGFTGTPPFANARGGKYMQSLPDVAGGGQSKSAATDPGTPAFMDYKVQIKTTGTYRLYIRYGGYDGSSDSLYAQILELSRPAGPGPNWYRLVGQLSAVGNNNNDFNNCADLGNGNANLGAAVGWNGVGGLELTSAGGGEVPMVWPITTPGIYTIRISQREDGSCVDAILLQLASLPEPTSSLVPESPISTTRRCMSGRLIRRPAPSAAPPTR
jgi:hypothetical protein